MDPLLVYTVSAVVMSAMAVVYFVNRMRLPSRQTGRWWGLAFLSGVLCATAYFVGQRTDDAWWTVSVGNATMVFTVGAAWVGCVVFNGRRRPWPLLCALLVVGSSVAVGVISALPSEYGTKYAGAAEKTAALALLSLLAVVECLRRPLRGYAGAWVIAGVFAVHLAYLVPRGVVFLTAGPFSPLFTTAFNTLVTTAMNIVLTVAVEAAILGIQFQHRRRLPTAAGYRPYPDRAPREQGARVLEGTLVVVGVDLWGSLRRAYGVDLARGLSLDLARAIAVALDEPGAGGAACGAACGDAEVWRLPEGRFAVRLADRAGAQPAARRAEGPDGAPGLAVGDRTQRAESGSSAVGLAAGDGTQRAESGSSAVGLAAGDGTQRAESGSSAVSPAAGGTQRAESGSSAVGLAAGRDAQRAESRISSSGGGARRARELVGRVRVAFAGWAALPEGRPTVSAVIVQGGGAPVSERVALACARSVFERRSASEIEWIDVVAGRTGAAAAPAAR